MVLEVMVGRKQGQHGEWESGKEKQETGGGEGMRKGEGERREGKRKGEGERRVVMQCRSW